MPKLRLTGRKAALVGVSAAAATAVAVAVAAPALAAPSKLTSCTETVRVRKAPDPQAPVIGSCKAGEQVAVDGTRNGFAHVLKKGGWVSLDYVRLRDASTSSSSPDEDTNPSDEDTSSSDETDSGYDKSRDKSRDRRDRYNDDNNHHSSGLGSLLGN